MGIEGTDHPGGIIVYGSTFVDSPREQETLLFIPEGYAVKVWFNGVLLSHTWRRGGGPLSTYVDFYPVTLKAGKNVLLFGSVGGNSRLPGFAPGTEYTASIHGMEYTLSDPTIYVGDTFTLDLRARNVVDFAGWQFDITFDPALLEAIDISEGDFLKTDGAKTFFQSGRIDNTTGKITGLNAARLNQGGILGTGILLSVTFKAKVGGKTQVALRNVEFGDITGTPITVDPHEVEIAIQGEVATGDVNKDGQVSILDMILVSLAVGQNPPENPRTDVNGDGVVDEKDVRRVAEQLDDDEAPAAPLHLSLAQLAPAALRHAIEILRIADDGSAAYGLAITRLQELLTRLTPEKTILLANYPNPFNPETWIPYQLSKSVAVTLTIYDLRGSVVRTLDVGHPPAGIYQDKSRAAYWDGRNAVGEPVASGVYFYTLTAGDFTATRKLLIRK
jgi:hypothetical protein